MMWMCFYPVDTVDRHSCHSNAMLITCDLYCHTIKCCANSLPIKRLKNVEPNVNTCSKSKVCSLIKWKTTDTILTEQFQNPIERGKIDTPCTRIPCNSTDHHDIFRFELTTALN